VKIDSTTIISAKNTEITFFVKFDLTAMSNEKKTRDYVFSWKLTQRPWFRRKKPEITFFRENWPDDHDLDGKKPEITFFSWKLNRRPWLALKIPELHFFVKFDPTAMSYAKKTKITFFRENWPDDHDLDGKTGDYVFSWKLTRRPWLARKIPKLHVFVKFDPTAMSYAEKTEITFFHENW
jgi:hypothetical protein